MEIATIYFVGADHALLAPEYDDIAALARTDARVGLDLARL